MATWTAPTTGEINRALAHRAADARTRAIALALLDDVSDDRSESAARWVASLDPEAMNYYARHNGVILPGGRLNPRKVRV